MKKSIFVCMLLLCSMCVWCAQRITFTVEGPESSYNQIRIVNETATAEFRCRITRLKADGEVGELYGVYELKAAGDTDTNTKKVRNGEQFVLDMPKDFPTEVGYAIEYVDLPLFDMVVIHLIEQDEFDPLK